MLMSEVMRIVKESNTDLSQSRITPIYLAQTLQAMDQGTISGKIAKDVLDDMAQTGRSPQVIIEDKGLAQVSDTAALESIAQKIIAANPTQKQQYLDGKEKLFGFFVGQMMKETKGQANPAVVNDILKKLLES
jgi:aspartyl-tRNA(Asn)/glutamyl-tRNA(Gln) amidotransferase subunit B